MRTYSFYVEFKSDALLQFGDGTECYKYETNAKSFNAALRNMKEKFTRLVNYKFVEERNISSHKGQSGRIGAKMTWPSPRVESISE